MKKNIVHLLFLTICYSIAGQNIDVVFRQDQYCTQMSLKPMHNPCEFDNPGPATVWFVFQDTSMVYYTNGYITPNLRHGIDRKRTNKNPDGYYVTFLNDTLYAYIYEGIDSCGRHWKEIEYINSLYITQHMINTRWYHAIIGYLNVENDKKTSFDEMLSSFRTIPSYEWDDISPTYQWVNNSEYKFRRLKYLDNPDGSVLDNPYVNYFYRLCE